MKCTVSSDMLCSINRHLCDTCNGMLVRPHHEAEGFNKFERRSGADIINSIKAGCRLCTMLGDIFKVRHLPLSHKSVTISPQLVALDEVMLYKRQGTGGTEVRKYPEIVYHTRSEVAPIKIKLVPKSDPPTMSTFSPFIKNQDFPISSSTKSNSSIEFINKWSSHCRKYHEYCKENRATETWLPTRLVDVGDTDSHRPRVVVTASESIKNCEYLCLSHRWIGMPVELESTNIDEFKKEIPIEKVSQTFRDAFDTTRKLGFRYIWIDSLCIMQDHQHKDGWQDWLTESARMGENYKHAFLTIAPTPTVDTADEFFANRDVHQRTPLEVNVERKFSEDLSYSRCLATGVDVSGPYFCFSEDIWLSQIDQAPLNRRGWVFQERLLSPRTVHFATEVLWECREKIASEMLPMGFPHSSSKTYFSGIAKCWPGHFPGGRKFVDQYSRWMEFVEKFSRCQLTMERDKLPAIAGVASLFQLPNDDYLAGLWRTGLPTQLIWRVSNKRLTEFEPPKDYRAPSWSWASVNGPIEFLADTFHIDKKSRYTAVVINSKVDLLVTNDPFGQVVGAKLCLKADLAHVSPEMIAANPEWMLTLDDNDAAIRVVTYYLCIFTAHVSWCNDLFLMVLEPTGTKSQEFRRIGMLFIRRDRHSAPIQGLKVFPECNVTIV